MFLVIHNIRSAHNVGAIFRTAEAVGVKKIYLVGVTPAPVDRFGRVNEKIAKSALGAEFIAPWQSFRTFSACISALKCEYTLAEIGDIIALEQNKNALDYRDIRSCKNFTLVVGNEVHGLPESVLKKCDKIVEIPMFGKKESLNVSVATGITLYSLAGHRRLAPQQHRPRPKSRPRRRDTLSTPTLETRP